MLFKASAPGSLMLLGEYAVLYGKQALVCALDKRLTVTLSPRSDNKIEIHSQKFGFYATDLNEIKIEKPFHFVLGVLKHLEVKLKRGCDISIESEFSESVGLGSSAATIVATLAALVTWLNIKISPIELIRQGKSIVRLVQGLGSGADIAASVYGGIVNYQAQPLFAEKIAMTYPLSVLYAGFKTPTVEAVKRVQDHFATKTALFRHIHNSIGQCAIDGTQFVRKSDWKQFGNIMDIQQGMMEALGVSSSLLQQMVMDLRQQPGILGAKISGSGLGDCVIALGELPSDYAFKNEKTVERIQIQMSLQGVQCEKI